MSKLLCQHLNNVDNIAKLAKKCVFLSIFIRYLLKKEYFCAVGAGCVQRVLRTLVCCCADFVKINFYKLFLEVDRFEDWKTDSRCDLLGMDDVKN